MARPVKALVALVIAFLSACGLPPKRPVYDNAFWRSLANDLPPPVQEPPAP